MRALLRAAIPLLLCATACDPFNEPEAPGFEQSASGYDPPASSAATPTEIDTSTALAAIVDGGYRSSAFTHATQIPYASSAVAGSFVDEWVSTGSYTDYSQVQPEAGTADVDLPPGSMVVRAVVDSTDTVSRLTVMLKGPSGYNPALGDWWFAETDPSGMPLSDDDGGVLAGRLTACYGCHVPRNGADYLFGVPLDDRPPSE